jgi:DNA mismatch repair protein MutS2
VELAELEPSSSEAAQAARPLAVVSEPQPERELKLIGMDAESAREELERYLDRAWSSGLANVRVVHGHGAGTLRAMVREACQSHPAVAEFHHPPQHRGGTGATEIELADTEAVR